ncbi:DUF805 domain-containing protein [Pseudovibrio brasiliensis]|uniref:DUF805 domain-containing protein n=1 Tax=Pseudovibrio brasiliensis TaxID=1898042 RepID=A0ABX8AT26_9HYPH|nr:DUF805 domain-containing protein [Pseudovibrio brasiliensis]QUS56769.1 DUF805 domain-containing protein [Pseudovibrio brasiliensis]
MALTHEQDPLTFKEAVTSCMKNYFNFHGRASRAEYWWWFFFTILATTVAIVFDMLVIGGIIGTFMAIQHPSGNAGDAVLIGMLIPYILTMIVGIFLILPTLTVAVRRLHDIDRSGFWVFIALIPFFGPLLLLYWHLLPSSQTVSVSYE